ncbi:phosphoenolpyruvate synthase, partial [cyanobacterium TDX16]
MNETFTQVRGAEEVLQRVRDCWASAFGPRVVAYRAEQRLHDEPAIAVVVQQMADVDRSGVAFTADPASGARDQLVVEAALGLGEVVVSGAVEPDTYHVRRDPPAVTAAHVGHQDHRIVVGPDGVQRTEALGPDDADRRVLTDDEVLAVADLALRVEALHGTPQDVEWAFSPDGRLALLQARPITTLGTPSLDEHPAGDGSGPGPHVLVTGLGATAAVGSGPVRVIVDPADGGRLQDGEVLVAPMTSPDWLPTLRRAAAVVTDRGGITCHAAIISRELGIPAVVGAGDATEVLHDGRLVTVDGTRGVVLDGERTQPAATTSTLPVPVARPESTPVDPAAIVPLATRLYVNLALPEGAAAAAAQPGVDGVGLLRAEMLLTDALGGVHPRAMVADGRGEELVQRLSTALVQIAQPFGRRPVVYRATDFRSNEFRALEGGERFEPVE